MEAYVVTISEQVVNYLMGIPLWITVIQVLIIYITLHACRGIYMFAVLRLMGRRHTACNYNRDGEQKILLVGDSTAVGTGACDTNHTLASFLAHDYPHTTIVNKAINGSVTHSVAEQLAIVMNEQFDMVIISTGGNDVWALTRGNKLRHDLSIALQEAKKLSQHRVILLFFGNEGSAPFFPFFLRPLIMSRTEYVRRIFSEVSTIERVPLIELFSNPAENPFVKNPKHFFAPDGLHPNEAGYWEWYKHLWRLLVAKNYLYHEERRLD